MKYIDYIGEENNVDLYNSIGGIKEQNSDKTKKDKKEKKRQKNEKRVGRNA